MSPSGYPDYPTSLPEKHILFWMMRDILCSLQQELSPLGPGKPRGTISRLRQGVITHKYPVTPIFFPMDDELQRIREKKLEELKKGIGGKQEKPGAKPAAQVLVLDERQFGTAVRDHPFLVVDLWAPWCGPCRMVAPVIEDLSAEFAGKISFGKLNTDENQRLAMRYGITAIPTIMLFAKGQLVDKIVGAYPKPTLRDRILRAFGLTG